LIYARLLPGKKAADILSGGPDAPPPVDLMTLGGVEALDIGQRQWLPTTLQAGTYVAVCFIQDPATQKPHAALGMLREFTVGTAAGPGNLPATGEVPVPVALPNTGGSDVPLLLLTAALVLFGLGATLRLRRQA
jgi:LPXTG-motif cell wall-anchored protein